MCTLDNVWSWWSIYSSIIHPCMCLERASWVKIFPAIRPIMQLDQTNVEEDLTGESWRQKYWLRFIGICMQKKNYKFPTDGPLNCVCMGLRPISSEGYHFTKCRLNCNVFRMQSWQNPFCYNFFKINRFKILYKKNDLVYRLTQVYIYIYWHTYWWIQHRAEMQSTSFQESGNFNIMFN